MESLEEGSTICIVRDNTSGATQKKMSLLVRPSYTVTELFNQVSIQFQYDNFELAFMRGSDHVVLNEFKSKTLREIGLSFSKDVRNVLIIGPITNRPINIEISVETSPSNDQFSDDDLVLGASASPIETPEEASNIPLPPTLPMLEGVESITSNYKTVKLYSSPRPAIGYVGLVNQAMTCYLNSLLQALFMTPEFRNALYYWESDAKQNGETKSIPYQLQKLFLNLQTSNKLAVETTDLTKSFGWDSTEAWQQHDIQELCRVMFDALEQKFKKTKQADLINRLYEGKMIDYVKCLECATEKSREDTFLDIPLPVRPFGSAAAYNSVEEAMRAFVQPETLDGNNQYFCEKCNKKCDAHKGLKFTKFPYILTLHLKRFDFDYQTLHRIKLNDKVTFPQNLNINGLINSAEGFASQSTSGAITTNGEAASFEKLNDDCSTTDSGSALEEDGVSTTNSAGQNIDQDLQEDDEGIDMSTSNDIKSIVSNEPGPYVYELFAIMIHSGSASGGHYYAYIKDFDNGEWYCFNDSTVTPITQEDITKSFGGGSTRAYYSGAYSSSTNAYMLMYRQVDQIRNCYTIKADAFPEHIKNLQQHIKDTEESDKKQKDIELGMQKLKIFFYNPREQRMVDTRLYMANESTLEDTLIESYNRLKLDDIVPIARCRLVAYDSKNGNCELSFEGRDQDEIGDIMTPLYSISELLIESREENTEFDVYLQGGILVKVYTVDVETSDIDGPTQVRCMGKGSIGDMKKNIATKLNLNHEDIILAMLNFRSEARLLDSDELSVVREQIYSLVKIFLTTKKCDEDVTDKFKRLVERFEHIITIYVQVPEEDRENLEKMGIPSYEEPLSESSPEKSAKTSLSPSKIHEVDEIDAKMLAKPASTVCFNGTGGGGDGQRISPLPNNQMETDCNSEDSSLSDGDRTLVESTSDIPNLVASSSVSHNNYYQNNTDEFGNSSGNGQTLEFDVVNNNSYNKKNRALYFKAVEFVEPAEKAYIKSRRMLKILVDRSMLVGKLKEHLQPVVKVPMDYIKLIRLSSNMAPTECTRLTESLNSFTDGEKLTIEFGRVLGKGEYKLKMYYLNLSETTDDSTIPYLCEWIFKSGATVGDTKRELLENIASAYPRYSMPFDKCRLRKKNCKNPAKLFLDDQIFDDDIPLTAHSEIIIQDLRDGRSQESNDGNDVVLFLRKWIPSEMKLCPYEEVTVKKNTEFKKLISELSGIPVENIEYAKLNGSFFRYTISVVSIHTNLSWSAQPITMDDWPMSGPQDGHIYFYRDSTDKLKELTAEERHELNGRENSRIERYGASTRTYSTRKERSLKIYLDGSPNSSRNDDD